MEPEPSQQPLHFAARNHPQSVADPAAALRPDDVHRGGRMSESSIEGFVRYRQAYQSRS